MNSNLTLKYDLSSNHIGTYQVFFTSDREFHQDDSISIGYMDVNNSTTMEYNLPKDVTKIRLDIGEMESKINLSNITLNYLWEKLEISQSLLSKDSLVNNIESITSKNNQIEITTNGNDPFIIMDLSGVAIEQMLYIDKYINYIFKVILCIVANIALFIFIKVHKSIGGLLRELYGNKNLMWNLSKNDFKRKYTGSYLGIFWAFIQPVVTVLVYWFVFQVGFKSAPMEDFPFILWFVAGIVPWFFFSEALINATNSMLEYSYLVKKVVFKISILPIVKIISASFVHLFFIVFTIVMFLGYGYMPTIYSIQVIYYTICIFIFVLGVSYATSAIIIFFKDLGQIINIVLQVGLWMTPIMWNYSILPEKYQWILKANPMYYIVEGYRDSLINKVWFWERYNQTIYFWIIAIGMFGIGTVIFKRLKIHFSDVL
jgi:teichoic acid transport system permease protein